MYFHQPFLLSHYLFLDLIGAVAVLANAYAWLFTHKNWRLDTRFFPSWSPLEPLSHCLVHTQSKLVILDAERAQLIHPAVQKLREDSQIQAFIVFDDHMLNNHWQGLLSFHQTLQQYHSDGTQVLSSIDTIKPEDNATIIFTSGSLTLFPKYRRLIITFHRDNRTSQRCSKHPAPIFNQRLECTTPHYYYSPFVSLIIPS